MQSSHSDTDGGEREAVRFEYFKWEIAGETSMGKMDWEITGKGSCVKRLATELLCSLKSWEKWAFILSSTLGLGGHGSIIFIDK